MSVLLKTEYIIEHQIDPFGNTQISLSKAVHANQLAGIAMEIAKEMTRGSGPIVSDEAVSLAESACEISAALWEQFDKRGWLQDVDKPITGRRPPMQPGQQAAPPQLPPQPPPPPQSPPNGEAQP